MYTLKKPPREISTSKVTTLYGLDLYIYKDERLFLSFFGDEWIDSLPQYLVNTHKYDTVAIIFHQYFYPNDCKDPIDGNHEQRFYHHAYLN